MITRPHRPRAVGIAARDHWWWTGALLALLTSTVESGAAVAQQASSIAAMAQVAPMSMAVTPEVVNMVLHNLSSHVGAAGSWRTASSSLSRSVALNAGLSTMEVRADCAQESEACELLVTVQFMAD
ncbi:MAG TPA: hypothetical protein VMG41_00020 [Gemmatimonadales bacterium]|nr:hypothetical protein [Gemmatimonadales bacterium]